MQPTQAAAQAPAPAAGGAAVSPPVENKKSPGLAAVLNFLWVGLGHIYCGDIMFGLFLMVAYPIVILLCFVTIICIPVPFIMWLWAIFDAYNLAKKINRGEVR
ncbi:MAG: hypothetical protein AB1529_07165 [Candidatus Micrarchaeota archaeon]